MRAERDLRNHLIQISSFLRPREFVTYSKSNGKLKKVTDTRKIQTYILGAYICETDLLRAS